MLKIENDELVLEIGDSDSFITIFDFNGNCLLSMYSSQVIDKFNTNGVDDLLVVIHSYVSKKTIYRFYAHSKRLVALNKKNEMILSPK